MIFATLVISIITLAAVLGLYLKGMTTESRNDGIILMDETRILEAIEGLRQQQDVFSQEIMPVVRGSDGDVRRIWAWCKRMGRISDP